MPERRNPGMRRKLADVSGSKPRPTAPDADLPLSSDANIAGIAELTGDGGDGSYPVIERPTTERGFHHGSGEHYSLGENRKETVSEMLRRPYPSESRVRRQRRFMKKINALFPPAASPLPKK